MSSSSAQHVAIIGAGPAGLMAAEVLAAGGAEVTVYDAMPSARRKVLIAGRGGVQFNHLDPPSGILWRQLHADSHLIVGLSFSV